MVHSPFAHPPVAPQHHLGALLMNQGKLAGAEALYREALAGFRRLLGNEHPDTLTSMSNLASLLQDPGKLAEAEVLYREALAGQRRVQGNEYPDTLTRHQQLGSAAA